MKPIRLFALVLCVALPFATQAAAPTMAESLKAAGRFSTYLSLQEIAGATQGQRSATQGQRTYFVPNDAAFSKLGAGKLEMLKKDPKRLAAFLQLHSVPSRVMVADMFEPVQGSKKSFQSSEGHVLGFQCNGHTGMHYPRITAFGDAPGTETAAIEREIRSSGVLKPIASATPSSGTGMGAGKVSTHDLSVAPTGGVGVGGRPHVKVFDGATAQATSIKSEIRSSGIVQAPPASSPAWAAPSQGRVGKFQDRVVAEGVVHEIDGVLLADGITN